MTERTYRLVVSVVFSLVAILHLARLIFGWVVVVNGTTVPFWLSWLGLVVGIALASEGFRQNR